VVADDRQVPRAQGLLADVPLGGPGQDVVRDAARIGHPREPEVGGQVYWAVAGGQDLFELRECVGQLV
jgi:hypothetical protein